MLDTRHCSLNSDNLIVSYIYVLRIDPNIHETSDPHMLHQFNFAIRLVGQCRR